MADIQCEQCGELSPPDANFCRRCGRRFEEVQPGLAPRLQTTAAVSDEVHLDTGRLVLLSALSSGLYFYFWAYLTWKHLASEAGDDHYYPVWHTLSFSVPIYGLFRLHRHISAIRDLAEGAGVWTGLGPGLVVVLFMISNGVLGAAAQASTTGVTLTLTMMSVVLVTTIMFRSQRSLNEYWAKTKGASVRTARMGAGGVITVIVGMLAWLSFLFPVPE